MSISTPGELCQYLTERIEDFLHHKMSWADLLDEIERTVSNVSGSCYGVGYSDGKNGKPEQPLWVGEWRKYISYP